MAYVISAKELKWTFYKPLKFIIKMLLIDTDVGVDKHCWIACRLTWSPPPPVVLECFLWATQPVAAVIHVTHGAGKVNKLTLNWKLKLLKFFKY